MLTARALAIALLAAAIGCACAQNVPSPSPSAALQVSPGGFSTDGPQVFALGTLHNGALTFNVQRIPQFRKRTITVCTFVDNAHPERYFVASQWSVSVALRAAGGLVATCKGATRYMGERALWRYSLLDDDVHGDRVSLTVVRAKDGASLLSVGSMIPDQGNTGVSILP